MDLVITVLVLIVLLLLKGFFSGSEIGFVSADRIRLRTLAAKGNRGAQLAQKLLADPARLLSTTLLGTNFATVTLATVGTILMVDLFGTRGELIAVIVFTPVFLILGEIVPKSIYQQKAGAFVPILAYPLRVLQLALAPLILVFSSIARLAARLVRGPSDDATATRELFFGAVRTAEQSATAAAFTRGQVRNVLRFAQLTAEEAMLPLADLMPFPSNVAMADVVAYRVGSGERLVPIYDPLGDRSCIVSVARIESWDLLDPEILQRDLGRYTSPHATVERSRPVSELISELHENPDLTLLVVDETGRGLGLITLRLIVRRTLGS